MKTKPMNGNTEDITIISNGVKIEGKVNSSGSIRIDGKIQGDLTAQGNVTVGEQGDINGQIVANGITIGGKVVGTVNAKDKLVPTSPANFKPKIASRISTNKLRDASSN